MRYLLHNRTAFSLLELVFVIVILGIVASIGSEIIARVYENYILQRAQHRASVKTELAATQIANRLRYALPDTVIRRITKAGAAEDLDAAVGGTVDDYNVLQWVGYDGDSFESFTSDIDRIPGWSGFCDLNASTTHIIKTPGSKLSIVNTIKSKFGYAGKFAIYFPGDSTAYYGAGTTDTIALDNNASRIMASKAAAIGTSKQLLLKNVSVFKFQGAGNTIRFKICKQENIGEDYNITSCKEKAVF